MKNAKNVVRLDDYRKDLVKPSNISKLLEKGRFRAVTIVGVPHDTREPNRIYTFAKHTEDAQKLVVLMEVASDSIEAKYEE